jgi:cell division protein ZapE
VPQNTGHAENKSPLAEYQSLMLEGELKPDEDQANAVIALERLYRELIAYDATVNENKIFSVTSGWLSRLFRWSDKNKKPPKGIYLYGGVGRGKSMLMDLFFYVAPLNSKRRVHFHEFMLDIHARLKAWHSLSKKKRSQHGKQNRMEDSIRAVAQQIATETTLLCFDELQVTDITDAMVVARLFEALFGKGVIVIATSNRIPDDLYKNGLNRQRFVPFIERIKETMQIVTLNGPTDYRYDRLKGTEVYLFPVNEETTEKLSAAFFRLTDRSVEDRDKVPNEVLTVQGRALFVPKAARGVAVFSFKRLCANPLGSADYLAIARNYHTVIMVAIPQFNDENSNEAARFVTFIDVLYEYGVKFLCSAAVPPQLLYLGGNRSFEFERTVSRLIEMQSEGYLTRGHRKQIEEY